MVPITAHFLQLTLCELWSRPYKKYLQLRIFSLLYSAVGICIAIRDFWTIQWALYWKHGVKHSPHPPVYAMWTVVLVIYNVFTAQHIQTSIFSCRYLRCNCRYLDNATRVILQTWSQMQRTSSSLRYMIWGPGLMQCTYSSAYSDFNNQLNVSALLLEIWRQFNAGCTTNFAPNAAHIP
jgi:hypothetical protein